MRTDDHKDLTEHRVSGETVFDGKLLDVRRDVVRLPDGKHAAREYIVHPGAVTIIPLLDSGELLMERQYRYSLARKLVELPAGKIVARGARVIVEGVQQARHGTPVTVVPAKTGPAPKVP